LEVFNDVFRQAEAAPTAVDAHRSLLLLQENAGVAQLPAPAVPSGIAFAELATPDAQPITEVLSALGFARTARHRSKPVDLWQQGQARILVNTGTAARRESTALAAIGLESPAPAAAARRAEALLTPVLPRRRTPEDVPLDAVAAPDGTELFFCATGHPELPDWQNDFTFADEYVAAAARAASADEAALGRIDHLALTQPWHHFDEAILFHRGVLGLSPQESVDVADPYGLLRSRAVSTAEGAVRIVLTVGATPTDGDAPAQHIAVTTDDVVTAARRYRAAGGRLLPIPANYYDDLAARYALPAHELERYRELGILYDRGAGGAFRHCYTRTVGRLFFELFQRDPGYQGYGAQNAPVRLAAQHAA
ncbi:4-hydroxyphenylpyruvate dioxygenase family protein, partial [Streptomyces sp. NPDC058286]